MSLFAAAVSRYSLILISALIVFSSYASNAVAIPALAPIFKLAALDSIPVTDIIAMAANI